MPVMKEEHKKKLRKYKYELVHLYRKNRKSSSPNTMDNGPGSGFIQLGESESELAGVELTVDIFPALDSDIFTPAESC